MDSLIKHIQEYASLLVMGMVCYSFGHRCTVSIVNQIRLDAHSTVSTLEELGYYQQTPR